MSIRNYSNTAAQSTLSANIGATDTTIALANYAGDPNPPFTAALARGTSSEEIVLVTSVIGSTVTVTRGYDGTSAQAQSAGATFQEVVVALDFREANNHVNATGAVHGTSSQLVGVSDSQTLTNKTLTAPTITNPTVTGEQTVDTSNVTTLNVSGVASLTTLNVSGAATFNGGIAIPAGQTVAGAAALTSGQVAATPAAPADIVRKDYADALGVSAPTAATIMRRDASGRSQVADPAAAADVASKGYVDRKFSDPTMQALTVNGGWSAASGHKPYCYFTADGRVRLVGWVSNVGAYTPNGTGTPVTLPTGYRPAQTQVFFLSYAGGAGGAPGGVIVTVHLDGTVSVDSNPLGPATIPAGSNHFLDAVEFHPTYTGA